MRKSRLWCWFLLLLLAAIPAFAEKGDVAPSPTPTVGFSARVDLSPPLRVLATMGGPPQYGPPREIPNMELKKTPKFPPALSFDPLVRPVPAGAPMPAPLITFDGPDDDDNQAIVGFRVAPPDSNGDVGPTHYVQFVNLVLEIFDKTTGATVLGPVAGNTPWLGFPGVCGTTNDGDPIALYDQFTGRWLLSQFSINTGTQCFAVSQTGDPTGAYWRYEFDISAGMNDYPKIGVWSDGYYLMFHEFNVAPQKTVVMSFEKAKMLQGQPAQFIRFALAPTNGEFWWTVQPPHVEGITPPPAGGPAPFVMQYDDEDWGATVTNPANDYIKIWKFHTDWVTPALSTFTGPTSLLVPEYDDNMCGFVRACIPQAPGGEKVDAISSYTMYRNVYRNFGDHQAVFTCETVDAGGDHAAIRWTEVRDPMGTPAVFQTGTHAPDALHRWMGSIAADKDGNVAIGYSVSDATMNPGIRYAGRLVGDPVGTLPQTEQVLHNGTGVQTSGGNRWGDYTTLSIDESDDCTFWYTNQYYQTSGSFDWDMRIGSFKFANCTAAPTGTLNGTVVDATTTNPIEGANISIGGTYSTQTNASGQYSILLPVGTYDVTASKFGYLPQTVTGVVISDGQTTTQDFALTGTPAITVDGFVTDGSGGNFPLYALVTVTSAGGTETHYTDPENGYYSFNALVATPYTISVSAVLPGYNVATRSITTGSVDQQENFALTITGACVAPGYKVLGFRTDFTAGIPAGWTVTNNTINCTSGPTWNTSNFGARSNLTGGAGAFAVADSDHCGSGVSYDSNLVSPPIDMTTATSGLSLSFNSDYNALCSPASPAFDYVAPEYTINGGATWVPFQVFCGTGVTASRRGPRVEAFNAMAANGAAAAQVRFRYKAGWDWWWEIDNVTVSRGCVFGGGGLIYGNVYDANTGLPINGATVALETGQTVQTSATPNDPNINDGFYIIYAPQQGNAPGVRTMTVTKTGYGTQTRQVIPVPGGSDEENFNMPAGMLSIDPQVVRKRLAIAGTGDSTVTLTNDGGLALNYNFLELNVAPPPSRPAGPFQVPVIPFDQNTKEGYYASIAQTAAGISHAPSVNGGVWPNAGEFVSSFPTAKSGSWGAGLDFIGSKFYVSNPVSTGGDDKNYQYTLAGALTGATVTTSGSGGTWVADMALNGLTGKMWQVNVGGDNCIFEWDPVALVKTGNKICPAFGTSMRGLAFDSASGHYFAGTWNGNFITEFTSTGSVVRNVTVNLPISGLAYNALTKHLFVQVNADATTGGQKIYVLDANQPALPQLGNFILKNSSGGNAFADFTGAGLEIDCSGNLWAVNQTDKNVYINNAGETGACSLDIPWLSEDPTGGTIEPGASQSSTWTFDAAGELPGCREGQVLVTNDTPYGTPSIIAGLTVQFNDVPLGAFGDAFIHGIAGAGISFGCGGGNFCPGDVMTRRLMPVWLLRGKLGRFYQPPPAVGVFGDVSPESFAADWIEDFYSRGFTSGCSANPLLYCPENPVTRAQMAVFLLVTKEGTSYVPPPCQGLFSDMPCSNGFTKWAEELYRRGITGGCSTNPLNYCPDAAVNRAQMSVFESVTFGIPKCKQ